MLGQTEPYLISKTYKHLQNLRGVVGRYFFQNSIQTFVWDVTSENLFGGNSNGKERLFL